MMPTACAVPELINQPWRRGSGGRTQLAGPHNGKRRRRDRGGHNKASAQSRMAASATVASTRCHGPLVSTSIGIPTERSWNTSTGRTTSGSSGGRSRPGRRNRHNFRFPLIRPARRLNCELPQVHKFVSNPNGPNSTRPDRFSFPKTKNSKIGRKPDKTVRYRHDEENCAYAAVDRFHSRQCLRGEL